MKLLSILGSFAILNLLNCSQVHYIASLSTAPPDLLYSIAGYLHNPFLNLGSLNRTFKKMFSDEFTVKRFIKDHLNLPEFVTDEVDENERELEVILSLSHFAVSEDYFHQALKNEYLHGKKFDVILPQLLKYFFIRNGNKIPSFYHAGVISLVKRERFDAIFLCGSFTIDRALNSMNYEDIKAVQKYLLTRPNHFTYITARFTDTAEIYGDNFTSKWIKSALACNMPNQFLHKNPKMISNALSIPPTIWSGIHVPKENYSDLFARINTIIGPNEYKESKNEFYLVLNSVRFGPDDPDIYDQIINSKYLIPFSEEELLLLCHCASLANKMDLFFKLIPKVIPLITEIPSRLEIFFTYIEQTSIDMHKFILDVYHNSDDSFRQFINDKTCLFTILSHFYKVTSINWNGNELKLEFVSNVDLSGTGIPERITVKDEFNNAESLRCVPFNLIFHSSVVFEEFLRIVLKKNSFFSAPINAENLKLIQSSDSLRHFLRKTLANGPFFEIELKEALKVLNDPVISLHDIVGLASYDSKEISDFKTNEQLERLEILTGCTIASLIDYKFDYFKYRHIYQYIFRNGKTRPSSVSETTFELLKIDFPSMDFSEILVL